MDTLKIAGANQPDMPWEDRPAGSKEVMWRYSANPIIGRHALSTSNSIFNSAVVPFKKGKYNYAGVFRCDDTNRRMRIHAALGYHLVHHAILTGPYLHGVVLHPALLGV